MKRLVALSVLALLATACTQDPVGVDYRGDEYYGRVHEGALDSPHHETFPEDSPRIKEQYARPVEEARVESVGVTDLPPPTPQASQPQQHTLTEAVKDESMPTSHAA